MMRSYRSDHPNHVHQLNVCVSKHYYVGVDGLVKYQKKEMRVSLSDASAVSRGHMVVYCMRDHCSGVFYAEVDFLPAPLDVVGFVGRAWGKKTYYDFCGTPDLVSIPRNVREICPELVELLPSSGIKVYEPESGFEAGIRDIGTLEGRMGYAIGKSAEFAKSEARRIMLSHSESKGRSGRFSKIEMWRMNTRSDVQSDV